MRRPPFALWFPLTLFAVSRLVSAAMISVAARAQIRLAGDVSGYQVTVPTGANPGYPGVLTNWDGQWYWRIILEGYPSLLPVGASGESLMNQWAFYPGFPLLVRAIMGASHLSFPVAASVTALVCSAGALLMLFRLLERRLGRFDAAATVTLLCTFMSAPVMQLAYSEGLALLLIVSGLSLLAERRYGRLVPVLTALALTRPVVLVFVPVIAAHAISRYALHFRTSCPDNAQEPFHARDRRRLCGLLGAAICLSGLWPAVAAVTTGQPNAYLRTMSAWAAYGKSAVGMAWLQFLWTTWGAAGLTFALGLAVLVLVLVCRQGFRKMGVEVATWGWAYPAYLFGATAPGPSVIRYLLLAFPLLWPLPGFASGRTGRCLRLLCLILLAACGLYLQWLWITWFWVVSSPPGARLFP